MKSNIMDFRRTLRQAILSSKWLVFKAPIVAGFERPMTSFNGTFRDEVLNRELFHSVKEAKAIAEGWRLEYNHHRPHSSLGYRTQIGRAHV